MYKMNNCCKEDDDIWRKLSEESLKRAWRKEDAVWVVYSGD